MPVDCRKCKHFKVTWEKDLPYICKAFGFKSKNMPSYEVVLAAGKECLKFVPKTQNPK